LTELDVRYPGDLGIGLSGLGIATCSAATLEVSGPAGCPADSRMGFGSVLVEIPIGPEIVTETGQVWIFRAADQSGHIAMLLSASGETPVYAQVVFPAILLPATWPFGGRLHVDVPLVPSLPEAPDVSVVRVRSTIGPQHLTYYERVHGRLVAYNPQGILLPDRCPRGGFAFAARLAFQDGSHASARTAVPCPRSRSKTSASGKRHAHRAVSRAKDK
jgi:hypothetical protein